MKLAGLRDFCDEVLTEVDGALGCAVVDVETGLPLTLSVGTSPLLSFESMGLAVAAAVVLFDGDRGDAADGPDASLDELQVTTDDAYWFMSRLAGDVRRVLIVLTDRRKTSLGMGWMSLRNALNRIESILGNVDHGGFGSPPDRNPDPGRGDGVPSALGAGSFNLRTRTRRSIWD